MTATWSNSLGTRQQYFRRSRLCSNSRSTSAFGALRIGRMAFSKIRVLSGGLGIRLHAPTMYPKTHRGRAMYELTVVCDCGNTVRLPASRPPQSVLHQLQLTTGGLPVNVLCPRCRVASAYSPDKFRRKFFRKPDQHQPHEDLVSVRIETECGEQGCKALVSIQMRMKPSSDIHEDALQFASEASRKGVVCKEGHVSTHPQLLSGTFRLLRWEGWESLDWESLPAE